MPFLGMEKISDTYSVTIKNGDILTGDWLFISSPIPTILICVLYMLLVKYGPRFMETKKALQLREVLFFYNLALVAWSTHMVYAFLSTGWFNGYSLWCQPFGMEPTTMDKLRMQATVHQFYLSKIVELLDTLFFILRKKPNQVTFLHVFHHCYMVPVMYLGTKYGPGGSGAMVCVLNASVHCVMYFYYALSALGPHMQPYLWWKRHLTKIQMIQFIMMFLHATPHLFNGCKYPTFIMAIISISSGFFLVLFANFYRQAYKKASAIAAAAAKQSAAEHICGLKTQ